MGHLVIDSSAIETTSSSSSLTASVSGSLTTLPTAIVASTIDTSILDSSSSVKSNSKTYTILSSSFYSDLAQLYDSSSSGSSSVEIIQTDTKSTGEGNGGLEETTKNTDSTTASIQKSTSGSNSKYQYTPSTKTNWKLMIGFPLLLLLPTIL